MNELRNYLEKRDWMSAFPLLDEGVKLNNGFHFLRGLVRECVSDLANALADIKCYTGELSYAKQLTEARLLAKLGYVDKAGEIIGRLPFLDCSSAYKDEDGVPFSYGIQYQYSDFRRLGLELGNHDLEKKVLRFPAVIKNGVKYALQVGGAFDTHEKLFQGITLPIREVDTLPAGELLITCYQQLEVTLNGVRGWLSPAECGLLFALAKGKQVGHAIVEIGSFYGRSAICLAAGNSGNHDTLVACDPHLGIEAYGAEDTWQGMKNNLDQAGFLDAVKIVRRPSLEAAKDWRDGPIGLVFIDALHDYENAKADFVTWARHVTDGGFIAFHDAVQPGVNQVVIELLEGKFGDWKPLGLRDSIFVVQKGLRATAVEMKVFSEFLIDKGNDFENWMRRDQKIIHSLLEKGIDGVL